MEHRKLSQLTGGLIESVCKTDYSSVLSNLAKGIAERQACQLPVPTGNGTDPSKFAVRISTPSGTPTTLERVTDASKCAAFPQGWYFDNNDNPKTVLLCAGACGTVREKTSSKMEALVGCAAPLPR
jgi:hypothetical protein